MTLAPDEDPCPLPPPAATWEFAAHVAVLGCLAAVSAELLSGVARLANLTVDDYPLNARLTITLLNTAIGRSSGVLLALAALLCSATPHTAHTIVTRRTNLVVSMILSAICGALLIALVAADISEGPLRLKSIDALWHLPPLVLLATAGVVSRHALSADRRAAPVPADEVNVPLERTVEARSTGSEA